MRSAPAEYKISDEMAIKVIQFLDKEFKKVVRRAVPMPEVYASFRAELGELEQHRFTTALSKAAKDGRIGKYEVLRGNGGGLGIPKEQRNATPPPPMSEEAPDTEIEEPLTEEEPSFKVITHGEPTKPPVAVDTPVKPQEALSESSALVPPPSSPTIPVVAPKKVEQPKEEKKVLFIEDREYNIPASEEKILTVLVNVFECKEDAEGKIRFGEKLYACDEQALHYLSNFVMCSMKGIYHLSGEGPNHSTQAKSNVIKFPERNNNGDSPA